jgi:hypothetical protein
VVIESTLSRGGNEPGTPGDFCGEVIIATLRVDGGETNAAKL